MRWGHGVKVIYLTTGGLTDMLKQEYEAWSKQVYREKSAEAIVLVPRLARGRAEP